MLLRAQLSTGGSNLSCSFHDLVWHQRVTVSAHLNQVQLSSLGCISPGESRLSSC